MRPRFRMDGRRGGLVASAVAPVEEVPPTEVDVEVPEPPRERLRFVRPSDHRVAAPQRAESTSMTERMFETLSSALVALAAKPAQPMTLQLAPSHVTLEVPPIELSQPPAHVEVNVPERSVQVNVPEQPTPVVNVTNEIPEQPAQLPPNVLVAAPEVTVQAAPPTIEVIVPEQPAPVVNVQNDVHVPRPRPVRVEKLAGGGVRYVPEGE